MAETVKSRLCIFSVSHSTLRRVLQKMTAWVMVRVSYKSHRVSSFHSCETTQTQWPPHRHSDHDTDTHNLQIRHNGTGIHSTAILSTVQRQMKSSWWYLVPSLTIDRKCAGVVVCLERGANDLHIVQLMPLPPHHLCFWKSRMVYPSGTDLCR